jgi:hypothetical protein
MRARGAATPYRSANTARFSRTVSRFGRSTYGDVKFIRGSTR